MNYARVISLNFRSADDLEIFYHKWDNWFPENMPTAISRTLVKTAENSTLMVAVYETEEIAEKAREIVENFFIRVAIYFYKTYIVTTFKA